MNIQEWVHYYKAYIFYGDGEVEDRSQLIELEVVVGTEFLRGVILYLVSSCIL